MLLLLLLGWQVCGRAGRDRGIRDAARGGGAAEADDGGARGVALTYRQHSTPLANKYRPSVVTLAAINRTFDTMHA